MSYDDFVKKIKIKDQDHALNLPDVKLEKAKKKSQEKSKAKKNKPDPDGGLIIQ